MPFGAVLAESGCVGEAKVEIFKKLLQMAEADCCEKDQSLNPARGKNIFSGTQAVDEAEKSPDPSLDDCRSRRHGLHDWCRGIGAQLFTVAYLIGPRK